MTAPFSEAISIGQARRLGHLGPLSRRRQPKPKRIVAIDIESKDGPGQRPGFTRPFLTGLYDGVKLVQWRNAPACRRLPWRERAQARGGCIDKMMRALLVDRYAGARIYAHFGGAFDFLFCVAWLAKSRVYSWRITPQGPNILALRVELARERRKDGCGARARRGRRARRRPRAAAAGALRREKRQVWTFVDSVRLLPMSLREAAKVFGATTQKGQMPATADEKDERWETYHAADLRALYESLTSVQELLQSLGGEMTLTAPSAALRLFQRRFLRRKVDRCLHEPDCSSGECAGCAHAFVRKAYKGGRVEAFRMQSAGRGRGRRLYYYDINSSYPAAMLFPQPTGPLLVHRGPVLPQPLSYYFERVEEGAWVGFAEARVRVPADPHCTLGQTGQHVQDCTCCPLPPLPLHEPQTGKLIFPVGTFRGTWDLSELALLPEVGGEVLSVERLYLYPAAPLLRTLVEELYPLRDATRAGYAEGIAKLVKLLLNALYGKFGQKPDKTEVVYLPSSRAAAATAVTIPEGAVPAGGEVGPAQVWYVPTQRDEPHIMPQIAAHVTSLARVRLWRGMWTVLGLGGRLYYCDTDSIVCDCELPSSRELGKLKREYPCPNLAGRFVRPKVYRLQCKCRDKRKCPWASGHMKKKGRRGPPGVKVVCKGIPPRVLTPEAFARLLKGDPVYFSRLQKLRTMAREGLESPRMVRTHKRLVSAYDKRIAREDGSTAPIVLGL